MTLPVTILLATRNEALNLPRCLDALRPAERVIVVDSASTDGSQQIALRWGAEVVGFEYQGGYPKKRQWALDTIPIHTPWIILLDADEMITPGLWQEIESIVDDAEARDAYLVKKAFHFLGRRFRFGGFSHRAVFLLRTGSGRFEHLFDDESSGLDMEVHERVLVRGRLGTLREPLLHEDFKGLEAYLERHNRYSTWKARCRLQLQDTGHYAGDTVSPRWFGDTQARRRALESLAMRLPFEPTIWFVYHYFLRLGFLEGRAGWIACQIRKSYVAQIRAKVYELSGRRGAGV